MNYEKNFEKKWSFLVLKQTNKQTYKQNTSPQINNRGKGKTWYFPKLKGFCKQNNVQLIFTTSKGLNFQGGRFMDQESW